MNLGGWGQLKQLATAALKDDVKEEPQENPMELLKAEFSIRIARLEERLKTITKERDELKKEKEEAAQQPQAPVQAAVAERTVESARPTAEHLDTIRQLTEEGEKLSKKQLLQESHIKKLRKEKEEAENTIKMLTDRSTNSESLLESKIIRIKELEMQVKKQAEQIAENGARTVQQLREVEENTRKECMKMLQENTQEGESTKSSMSQTITQLRNQILILQEKAGNSEDQHLNDVVGYKQRAEEAEMRNQELIQSIPEATRQLTQQIQNLNMSINEERSSWEKIEDSLNSRLNHAEIRLREALDREKEALHANSEANLQFKMLSAEEDAKGYEQRLDDSQKQIEHLLGQLQHFKVQVSEAQSQLKVAEKKHQEELKKVSHHAEMLKEQLSAAQMRLNELSDRQKDPATPTPTPEPHISRQNSSVELQQFGLHFQSTNYNSLPLEKMNVFTKQKEGELLAVQAQKNALEQEKQLLQDELVRLTSQNETLKRESEELRETRNKLEDLGRRYDTALVLIGEKEEEVEEKRADIVDMKALYKGQITELLEQIDRLNRSAMGLLDRLRDRDSSAPSIRIISDTGPQKDITPEPSATKPLKESRKERRLREQQEREDEIERHLQEQEDLNEKARATEAERLHNEYREKKIKQDEVDLARFEQERRMLREEQQKIEEEKTKIELQMETDSRKAMQEEEEKTMAELKKRERQIEEQVKIMERQRLEEEAKMLAEMSHQRMDRQEQVKNKRGILWKQGHWWKSWQQRYFEIDGDTMSYYVEPDKLVMKGSFPLKGSTVSIVDDTEDRTFCFRIDTTINKSFLISAESTRERQEWMDAVKFGSHGFLVDQFMEDEKFIRRHRATINSEITRIARRGYLEERSTLGMWTKRYFVLHSNPSTDSIIVFDDESMISRRGEIKVEGAVVERSEIAGKVCCLVIRMRRPPEETVVWLSAQTEEERTDWIDAITIAQIAIHKEKVFVNMFMS
ncbi:hypothetical protein PROFUN_03265 [Planoprotostelium fungivorum]|uniref:PH domain-containing protein n=1 Tax=Planoprotostelium fungivorum TaxID=1890364 RepID=A0A2P6NWM3_9EUKA|nr:hypothetical protein PROFUN_03265 [Planoprotostelium fungivorum]